jgi:hypothetical protein
VCEVSKRQQRAESREQRAKSKEQRAESREQRAESRDQREYPSLCPHERYGGIRCAGHHENLPMGYLQDGVMMML